MAVCYLSQFLWKTTCRQFPWHPHQAALLECLKEAHLFKDFERWAFCLLACLSGAWPLLFAIGCCWERPSLRRKTGSNRGGEVRIPVAFVRSLFVSPSLYSRAAQYTFTTRPLRSLLMTKKKRSHPSDDSQQAQQPGMFPKTEGKPQQHLKMKPWCWYCDREFDDDKVLIQHQKARHFKCSHCHRKLNSGSGLVIHVAQVHKVTMERVPNAIAGHDTPEVEVYGMEGIPTGDLERHRQGLPPQPFKRPKFLESGGLLPLLAAQKASAGAISITGRSELFDETSPTLANTAITALSSMGAASPSIANASQSFGQSASSQMPPAASQPPYSSAASAGIPQAYHMHPHMPMSYNHQHYHHPGMMPPYYAGQAYYYPPQAFYPQPHVSGTPYMPFASPTYASPVTVSAQPNASPQALPAASPSSSATSLNAPALVQEEPEQPRITMPYIDPATGKSIAGQMLFVSDPSTSLEEQRAALYRKKGASTE